MFEVLQAPPADKIIELIGIYAADPRTDKLDLGIGVYKDEAGRTPIMHAVKAAERRLWEDQETKSYLGVTGDRSFVEGMRDLIFAGTVPAERIGGVQTPGGTGAVRQLLELVKRGQPDATVWYSDPTWPNHPAILSHLGIASRSYRYYDAATGAVAFDGDAGGSCGGEARRRGDPARLLPQSDRGEPVGRSVGSADGEFRCRRTASLRRSGLSGLRRRARGRRGGYAAHGGKTSRK